MQVWEHCKQDEPKARMNSVVVQGPRPAEQLGRARPWSSAHSSKTPHGGRGARGAPGVVR